jgi:uncharacterized protein
VLETLLYGWYKKVYLQKLDAQSIFPGTYSFEIQGFKMTTSLLTSEQILRDLFDYFLGGDIDSLLTLVDSNCKWLFPGSKEILPWAGEFRGHDIVKFFDIIFSTIEYMKYTPHTYYSQGDVVTILSHEECFVKSTGKTFKNDLVAVATVKNGKLVEFLEYSDTAAMQAAFLA